MKLFKVSVNLSGPGDFIVVAEDKEKAADCVRPFYEGVLNLDDDIFVATLSDLTEEFVHEIKP